MVKGEQYGGKEFVRDVAVISIVGALALAGLDMLSDS